MKIQQFIKEVKHSHPEFFIKSTLKGFLLIAHAWLVILASAFVFSIFPNLIVGALVVLIIGSRQLGIAVLMHEAAHRTLVNGKNLNDFLGSWFCSLPVIYSLKDYRAYHLQHHQNTQQSNDPDLHLSKKFPVTSLSMARKFIRDLSGLTGLKLRFYQLRGFILSNKEFIQKSTSFGRVLLSQLILFGIFSTLFSYEYYFYFWLLPLLTWFQFITRVRNIAEHAMVLDDDNPLLHARHIDANLIERAFFAPYFVNYHLEHHLLMSLPCYKFKVFYGMLVKKFGKDNLETKSSYFEVVRMAALDS
ncbi:MAG: fatty acid desaturase family protein [Gammaproteobacteria bacterium]